MKLESSWNCHFFILVILNLKRRLLCGPFVCCFVKKFPKVFIIILLSGESKLFNTWQLVLSFWTWLYRKYSSLAIPLSQDSLEERNQAIIQHYCCSSALIASSAARTLCLLPQGSSSLPAQGSLPSPAASRCQEEYPGPDAACCSIPVWPKHLFRLLAPNLPDTPRRPRKAGQRGRPGGKRCSCTAHCTYP